MQKLFWCSQDPLAFLCLLPLPPVRWLAAPLPPASWLDLLLPPLLTLTAACSSFVFPWFAVTRTIADRVKFRLGIHAYISIATCYSNPLFYLSHERCVEWPQTYHFEFDFPSFMLQHTMIPKWILFNFIFQPSYVFQPSWVIISPCFTFIMNLQVVLWTFLTLHSAGRTGPAAITSPTADAREAIIAATCVWI